MPLILAWVAISAASAAGAYFVWGGIDSARQSLADTGNLLDKPTIQLGAVALALFATAAVLKAKHGGRL